MIENFLDEADASRNEQDEASSKNKPDGLDAFNRDKKPEEKEETSGLGVFEKAEEIMKNGHTKNTAKQKRFKIWYPNPYFIYLCSGPGIGKERLETQVIPAYFEQLVHYMQNLNGLDEHLLKYMDWLRANDSQREKNKIEISESPENFYHCTLIGQYALISLVLGNKKREGEAPRNKIANATAQKVKARKLIKETAYAAVIGLNPRIKENPSKMDTCIKTQLNEKLIDACIDDAVQAFMTRFRLVHELLNYEKDRRFFKRALDDTLFTAYMQRIEYLLGLDNLMRKNCRHGPFDKMLLYVLKSQETFPDEFIFVPA